MSTLVGVVAMLSFNVKVLIKLPSSILLCNKCGFCDENLNHPLTSRTLSSCLQVLLGELQLLSTVRRKPLGLNIMSATSYRVVMFRTVATIGGAVCVQTTLELAKLTQANVRKWLAMVLKTTARTIFKSGRVAEGYPSDEAQKPCAALFTITSSNTEK